MNYEDLTQVEKTVIENYRKFIKDALGKQKMHIEFGFDGSNYRNKLTFKDIRVGYDARAILGVMLMTNGLFSGNRLIDILDFARDKNYWLDNV